MAKANQPQQPETIEPGELLELLMRVHEQPTIANIAAAAKRLAPCRGRLAAVQKKIACLSSFTFDLLRTPLELQALRAGIELETLVAPFGRFDQELIDPNSSVAAFKPDVVLLALRLRDVCCALYDAFNSLSAEQAASLLDDWFARLQAALATFRARSSAHVLILNYEQPAAPALGLADRAAPHSQTALIRGANQRLDELAVSLANAHVLDYDGLVAAHGRLRWEDPRMALYARIPIAAAHSWPLAGFVVRHLRPLFGLSKKVLVLDADNTLWGGVLGDVGLEGIQLGEDYPGSAYVAFQKAVLDLYHRGVVLCIASKNQPGTVEEALEKHPNMVLRPSHFAAMRVNWDHKAESLRQMADELNLGIDSFVFVDDSPVECGLMSAAFPQVLCVLLPKEPAQYASVLRQLDCFDQYAVSDEDRKRGELYRAEAGRKQLQAAAVDMPAFYRQLEMRVRFTVNEPAQAPRASQMTNRTNQFNMHTIRCSEDDIRRFMASGDHDVVTLALEDRFGDSGVVGLTIVRRGAAEWVLHLFLMSCRILGRTVEQAFVKWIAKRAQAAGATALAAEFVPTAKNKPFAGFYESCGFVPDAAVGDIQRFSLPLAGVDLSIPDWITVEAAAPERP